MSCMSTASLLDVLGRRLDENHLPPLQSSDPLLPILQTKPDLVEALISLSTFPILFNTCEWPQVFGPSGNLEFPSSFLQYYIRVWTMLKINLVCVFNQWDQAFPVDFITVKDIRKKASAPLHP